MSGLGPGGSPDAHGLEEEALDGGGLVEVEGEETGAVFEGLVGAVEGGCGQATGIELFQFAGESGGEPSDFGQQARALALG